MNRPGSGQPDEFAARGTCENRLPEHFTDGVSLFCVGLSVASGSVDRRSPVPESATDRRYGGSAQVHITTLSASTQGPTGSF